MDPTIQKPFKIIVAVSADNGIGLNGNLPWTHKSDMKHFKRITTTNKAEGLQNAVIMGSNTWKSLNGHRPLRDRINVVITRNYQQLQQDLDDHHISAPNLLTALNLLNNRYDVGHMYVIGGRQLYQEAITINWSHELIVTQISHHYECDTYFPDIPDYWILQSIKKLDTEQAEPTAIVSRYRNFYAQHYELQYLGQMAKLRCIPPIIGRNGPVHTDFQWSLNIDLQDGFPLFSTRRGFWRGICEELLFFIRGDTNSNHLSDKGIRIWEGNTTREFLDQRGLDYKVGDMGPMYGWVWRNYGAQYKGMDHDYTDEGYDQLKEVLDKLQNAPNDRRILMTAYDPSIVQESVLAPCHSIVIHFFVRKEDDHTWLDMFTYQRSADMFLGVYFNIPSNALLLSIIATAVGMKPGKLHMRFGNNHVYHNHLDALEQQLQRAPSTQFPILELPTRSSNQDPLEWISSLEASYFKLLGYEPQGAIKADMVA